MYGLSTGFCPNQPKSKKSETKNQYTGANNGRNLAERNHDKFNLGKNKRINIDKNIARTPPSLFGIERNIA